MPDFKYALIKVCYSVGKEYYHVYPEKPIGFLPEKFGDLNVKKSHPEYCVLEFSDCCVTVFGSGRMLIEDLPQDSEDRAHEIINMIISVWVK